MNGNKIKAYLRLAKPGVMLGNLITTVAGFLFAANGTVDWVLFVAASGGTALVISSACVINNYLDQDIDAKMERTKKRPLIAKEVNPIGAILFGAIIGVLGMAILVAWTNWWVVGVGLFGFVTYVWLYGVLGKRKSVHGTLVGALSGAAPILAGYVAVIPGIDVTGLLLFAVIFFWQMPEFYSISIYRRKEYAKAGVPVSSVVRGVAATKKQIFFYTALTVISLLALGFVPLASRIYLLVMGLMCVYWLKISMDGLSAKDDSVWARKNFHAALNVLMLFSFMISINSFLT